MKNRPILFCQSFFAFGKLIKKTLVFFLLLTVQSFLMAQHGGCPASCNLVKNGCFDQYSSCPTAIDQTTLANFWFSFGGKPDYLNGCGSIATVTVPQVSGAMTVYEHTTPMGTNGMMRIRTNTNGSNKRDYLQQGFSPALAAGSYYAEMFVHLRKPSLDRKSTRLNS